MISKIQTIKTKIEKLQEALRVEEAKKKLENSKSNWIKVKLPTGTYEVETKVSPDIKFKDIQIPEGCSLLTFEEAVFLFDNHQEVFNIGKNREWIEHYSKKMKEDGYFASLSSCVDDRQLYVLGNYWLGCLGFAFGVRFKRKVK